jgi:quercetin dioxygenase-like cupin family protein
VSAFTDLGTAAPQQIWDGVVGRTVHGERITLSLIELEPGVAVPEHDHVNEQMGVVLSGALTFTVGGETKELGPGEAWCITAHVPHSVVAGPAGTVLVEVFSPTRDDWAGLDPAAPRPARWPERP